MLMKRYFLITFIGVTDYIDKSEIGSICVIGDCFPSRASINKQIEKIGLKHYSIINVFEFRNRYDYESFIGVTNEN